MSPGSDQQGSQAGQATVELMLVLPVIIAFAMLIGQIGVVVRDSMLLHHAARAAAREAAVDPTDSAARLAAVSASQLDRTQMEVSLSGGRSKGDHITAEVRYVSRTDLPVVGWLLPDVNLRAEVTMRVE